MTLDRYRVSYVNQHAFTSPDNRYRFHLHRAWKPSPPAPRVALFVMLNPSTASDTADDTIRKCVGFAHRWGLGAIDVVNLYAYRATDPLELDIAHAKGADVVGDERVVLSTLEVCARSADRIVVAWGGRLAPFRDQRVGETIGALRTLGRSTECLGRTADGSPRHPLMLAYSTPLETYSEVP
jgi:hypothetical protein